MTHLTLNDRQGPGPTQPMLAHSSAKLSCFDLIGIDVVGRVPMDVANDVAALRSCCAVSPARPRVRIMTSSSMSADGTVGSTGAAVVSELEPGKNTTSHPEGPQSQGAKDPREVQLGPGENAYDRSDDFLLEVRWHRSPYAVVVSEEGSGKNNTTVSGKDEAGFPSLFW